MVASIGLHTSVIAVFGKPLIAARMPATLSPKLVAVECPALGKVAFENALSWRHDRLPFRDRALDTTLRHFHHVDSTGGRHKRRAATSDNWLLV